MALAQSSACAYSLSGPLRLARFNICANTGTAGRFPGLPITAAASVFVALILRMTEGPLPAGCRADCG